MSLQRSFGCFSKLNGKLNVQIYTLNLKMTGKIDSVLNSKSHFVLQFTSMCFTIILQH